MAKKNMDNMFKGVTQIQCFLCITNKGGSYFEKILLSKIIAKTSIVRLFVDMMCMNNKVHNLLKKRQI